MTTREILPYAMFSLGTRVPSDVLDENADSCDTIIEVVTPLHHEFHIGGSRDHFIVAGDVKTLS